MKDYSFTIWSDNEISYKFVDLTRHSTILLKEGKRIKNTFKRSQIDYPSNDQWCIDIISDSCDLICSCDVINEITEFQIYKSDGEHLFDIGENKISSRISAVQGKNSKITLTKGKYTLVPIFAKY